MSSHDYELLKNVSLTASDGSHKLCATIADTNVCSQFLVYTSCQPKLGFIFGGVGIAYPSMNLYKPPEWTAQFTLVGDAFHPFESITIEIDGVLFTENICVDSTGHFSVDLTMPTDELYGVHNVTAVGQGTACKPVKNAAGTFTLVKVVNF